MKKVLIIDDSNTNVVLFQDVVEDIGYIPIIAQNGKDAMEIIENEHVDLILLDIMMPDINGLDLLGILKADEKTKDIAVIMITAKTDRLNQKAALEKGAIAYYTKPVDIMRVMDKIKSILQ